MKTIAPDTQNIAACGLYCGACRKFLTDVQRIASITVYFPFTGNFMITQMVILTSFSKVPMIYLE